MHFGKISFICTLFFAPLTNSCGDYAYPEDLQMEYFESGFKGSISEYVASLGGSRYSSSTPRLQEDDDHTGAASLISEKHTQAFRSLSEKEEGKHYNPFPDMEDLLNEEITFNMFEEVFSHFPSHLRLLTQMVHAEGFDPHQTDGTSKKTLLNVFFDASKKHYAKKHEQTLQLLEDMEKEHLEKKRKERAKLEKESCQRIFEHTKNYIKSALKDTIKFSIHDFGDLFEYGDWADAETLLLLKQMLDKFDATTPAKTSVGDTSTLLKQYYLFCGPRVTDDNSRTLPLEPIRLMLEKKIDPRFVSGNDESFEESIQNASNITNQAAILALIEELCPSEKTTSSSVPSIPATAPVTTPRLLSSTVSPVLSSVIDTPEQKKEPKCIKKIRAKLLEKTPPITFDNFDAVFENTNCDDPELLTNMLKAKTFDPNMIQGGCTLLTRYLYQVDVKHSKRIPCTLKQSVIKVLIENGCDPHFDRGPYRSFVKAIKHNKNLSDTEKEILLAFVMNPNTAALETAAAPAIAPVSNSTMLASCIATSKTAPDDDGIKQPKKDPSSRFTVYTVLSTAQSPVYPPSLPSPSDKAKARQRSLSQYHVDHIKEKFTYEELAMAIRCLDGEKAEDIQFLEKILKSHANIHEKNSHDHNQLFSLIPRDDTPISLPLLQVLLKAGINPSTFMKYLKNSFSCLNQTSAQAAYECCQKFLARNSSLS
jgi:hypothetical protein